VLLELDLAGRLQRHGQQWCPCGSNEREALVAIALLVIGFFQRNIDQIGKKRHVAATGDHSQPLEEAIYSAASWRVSSGPALAGLALPAGGRARVPAILYCLVLAPIGPQPRRKPLDFRGGGPSKDIDTINSLRLL
jgi:hypothetical protein